MSQQTLRVHERAGAKSLERRVERVDGGRWRVDGGRWRVDGGEWTVESGEWTVESGWSTIPIDKRMLT